MQNSTQQFDVIISGGGLSGSLMALSLSKLRKVDGSLLSIAIVEAQVMDISKPVDESNLFDARVLALSHGSAKYLEKLGAWQHINEQACAITDIDISDRGHYGKARLTASEHGVNALGYVVDMAVIGKAQLTALNKASEEITWFSPDSIQDIEWQHHSSLIANKENKENKASKDQVRVTLSTGKKITANLIIACDGVQSPVRKLANIDVSSDDYNQVALIANVVTKKAHNNKAFERFTEFGPLAMLPLTAKGSHQNRCSLVWTMTPAQADYIHSLDDHEFLLELENAFGSFLGEIIHVGKRDSYPLKLLQAHQQTYHRTALVGNSSHTIHPIAGQGFNLGLRDVKVMSELVGKALLTGRDVGSFALLQAYQQNRIKDQQHIIKLTDSLVRLFANDLPPLVIGRNIGLQALNFISPLKKRLVKKTMGY